MPCMSPGRPPYRWLRIVHLAPWTAFPTGLRHDFDCRHLVTIPVQAELEQEWMIGTPATFQQLPLALRRAAGYRHI